MPRPRCRTRGRPTLRWSRAVPSEEKGRVAAETSPGGSATAQTGGHKTHISSKSACTVGKAERSRFHSQPLESKRTCNGSHGNSDSETRSFPRSEVKDAGAAGETLGTGTKAQSRGGWPRLRAPSAQNPQQLILTTNTCDRRAVAAPRLRPGLHGAPSAGEARRCPHTGRVDLAALHAPNSVRTRPAEGRSCP